MYSKKLPAKIVGPRTLQGSVCPSQYVDLEKGATIFFLLVPSPDRVLLHILTGSSFTIKLVQEILSICGKSNHILFELLFCNSSFALESERSQSAAPRIFQTIRWPNRGQFEPAPTNMSPGMSKFSVFFFNFLFLLLTILTIPELF